MLALIITADGIHLINREPEDGEFVFGRRFAVWKRDEVKAVIEQIPGSPPKLKISHGNESYEMIPKEEPTSPGAYLKVLSLLSETR